MAYDLTIDQMHNGDPDCSYNLIMYANLVRLKACTPNDALESLGAEINFMGITLKVVSVYREGDGGWVTLAEWRKLDGD